MSWTGRLPDIDYARQAERVPGADEKLTVRPSPTGGVLTTVWVLFLCLVMVLGAANEHDLLLVLVWLPWLVPIVLVGRYRLSVGREVLTYRSPPRTGSWRRGQVAEFGIIQSGRRAWIG